MATLRQIAANQQNAARSTGPVTDEGKDASRSNSLKHGLTSALILRDDDQEAVDRRLVEWRANYWLDTTEKEWIFKQMVIESVKLDRCHEEQSALRLRESQRAALSWDDDRRDEIEEIAAKLGKRPAQVSRRLQRTRQGADWMIERWRTLATLFERNGEWTNANALAHDLQGTPAELRDEAPIEDPATLVMREIAALERRKLQSLDALDDLEREAAINGFALTPSKAMNALRRHETACQNNYLRAAKQIEIHRLPTPATTPSEAQGHDQDLIQKRTQWLSGQAEPIETPGFAAKTQPVHANVRPGMVFQPA